MKYSTFKKVLFLLMVPLWALSQTCPGILSDNLFPDGDFGSGPENILPFDPGIAPGYIYQFSPPPNDGFYCIANNTSTWGSFASFAWIDIEDNSNDPEGYMMIVNATFAPGIFYQQTVAVCENTAYEFSADIINLFRIDFEPGILPNIDFLINGQTVFNSGNVPQDESWQTYGFTFFTDPGANEITLSLRNNAPGGSGNDLALDNISFRVCGPVVDLPDTTVLCGINQLELIAELSESSFSTPQFLWQQSTDEGVSWADIPNSNSNLISLSDVLDGTQLRVIIANSVENLAINSCNVISDPVVVVLSEILQIDNISTTPASCNEANGSISIAASSGNQSLQYALNGGDFGPNPFFDDLAAGTYLVAVENELGCITETSVEITAPFTPEIEATTLSDPNCTTTTTDLSILATGGTGSLTYSLDGNNFQANNQFIALAPGEYVVYVQDELGCVITDDLLIPERFPVSIENVLIEDTSCGLENGTLTIEATGSFSPFFFSIDDEFFQPENNFQSLRPNNYSVFVEDQLGCQDSLELEIKSSIPVAIDTIQTLPTSCGLANGSVNITVDGGIGELQFILNDSLVQNQPFFDALSSGFYTIMVEDERGCLVESSFAIDPSVPVQIDTFRIKPTNCGVSDGNIEIQASGGNPPLSYQVNSQIQANPFFEGLPEGELILQVVDQDGCVDAQITVLPEFICYYIPNAFSPNDDGVNDFFSVFSNEIDLQVLSMKVFDRWGNFIFEANDLEIGSPSSGWDGTYRGQPSPTGIYTYAIELQNFSGDNEVIGGDVLLLR